MKLHDRERIEGTNVTIGRRVYYRDGRQKVSSIYAAEYRDASGKQSCESLGTRSRLEARRAAVGIELIIANTEGIEKIAFATLAYTGLRIGELEQLQWIDVMADRGELGMLHIRRGGSNGTTKDKDERFVPIHPRIRPLLDALPRTHQVVFPTISERQLLKRVKVVCHEIGLPDPNQYKLHSFRHHFASLCANHQVAYRKALAWLGHSSSQILDLYYHLHDADSQSAMKSLAADGFSDVSNNSENPGPGAGAEGTLRAIWGSTNEKRPEDLWGKELLSVLGEKTERAGFEPAEQGIPHSTV